MNVRILYVCTGNLCRSPYMQLLTATLLAARGIRNFSITSGGTRATPGRPIAETMGEILRDEGIASDRFRSAGLAPSDVAAADLVLTAERAHRAEICRLQPSALRKTFTLRQAARILADCDLDRSIVDVEPDSAHRLQAVSELIARRRGRAGPAVSGDDVADPWRQSPSRYLESVHAMRPSLIKVIDTLEWVASPEA